MHLAVRLEDMYALGNFHQGVNILCRLPFLREKWMPLYSIPCIWQITSVEITGNLLIEMGEMVIETLRSNHPDSGPTVLFKTIVYSLG